MMKVDRDVSELMRATKRASVTVREALDRQIKKILDRQEAEDLAAAVPSADNGAEGH